MDKRRRETYRKRLEAELAELRTLLERTEQAGRSIADKARGDEGEEAAKSYDREILFSQSDGERAHLNMVAEALERFESGEFGICIECGEAIKLKRLDAVPWTRYCRDCQEEMEKEAGAS